MNILLCGIDLPHEQKTIVPLDLAYVKTFLQARAGVGNSFDFVQFAIQSFAYNPTFYQFQVKKSAHVIEEKNPDAAVFFLDNIIWSMAFYLGVFVDLAREVKKKNPHIAIGLQSYKVDSAAAKEILRKNTSIDFFIIGDPGIPLREAARKETWEDIPGIMCRKTFLCKPERARALSNNKRLDAMPSPYLVGNLDSYLPRRQVLLSTKQGCPGRCYYCFRSVKFTGVRFFSFERVMKELKYLAERGIKNAFVIDDCFAVSTAYLESFHFYVKKTFGRRGNPVSLAVMCRPEQLSERNIFLLQSINVSGVQIGLQSINEKVGYIFGRESSLGHIVKIMRLLREAGILAVQIDLIMGLPGDTFADFKRSLQFAFEAKPQSIQVKQLSLNPLTRFELNRRVYGIKLEVAQNKFAVPFVTATNTYSQRDMKRSHDYLVEFAKKNIHLGWKITTGYGRIFNVPGRRILETRRSILNNKGRGNP